MRVGALEADLVVVAAPAAFGVLFARGPVGLAIACGNCLAAHPPVGATLQVVGILARQARLGARNLLSGVLGLNRGASDAALDSRDHSCGTLARTAAQVMPLVEVVVHLEITTTRLVVVIVPAGPERRLAVRARVKRLGREFSLFGSCTLADRTHSEVVVELFSLGSASHRDESECNADLHPCLLLHARPRLKWEGPGLKAKCHKFEG